jgi:hypothetical protein
MRKIFAFLAFLSSLGLAMQAWVASDQGFVANAISNNIVLNKKFRAASDWVSDFHHRNGRFPTSEELQSVRPPIYFDLQTRASSIAKDGTGSIPDALEKFGAPPASSDHPFFLIEWGYDIPKIWASWLQTSNAHTDAAFFYTLGSSRADTWLFSACALFLLCIGTLLWRWRGTSGGKPNEAAGDGGPLI